MKQTILLPYDPLDFSLDLCVTCGQVFRWQRTIRDEWIGVDGDHWYRVVQGAPRVLRIDTSGTEQDARSLFRLDWDGPFTRSAILTLGPELQPYIQALPGLRMMRPSSAVEALFSFLCTPNNHLSRITSMIHTLSGYGDSFVAEFPLRRFPSLETIAAIPEPALREAGFGYRAATIPKVAQTLLRLGGTEYLRELERTPYEETHSALMALPGIGPKLADCIALYAFDQTCAVPVDTHVWQAAVRLYFPQWERTNLTALKYRAIGNLFRERFGTLAGWAHQYLFYDNLLNWRQRRSGQNSAPPSERE